jgi:hypothetical protein
LPKFRTLHSNKKIDDESNSDKCNSFFRVDGDKMIEYILPRTTTESQELHITTTDSAPLFSENCDIDEEVVLQTTDEQQQPDMDNNIQILSPSKDMNCGIGYRIVTQNNQMVPSFSVDDTIYLQHPPLPSAHDLHHQFAPQTVDKYFNFDYERDSTYVVQQQQGPAQNEEQLIPYTPAPSTFYIEGEPSQDECKLEEDNENSTSSKCSGQEMTLENVALVQTSTEIVPESIVQQILVEEKNEEDELTHQNDIKNMEIQGIFFL